MAQPTIALQLPDDMLKQIDAVAKASTRARAAVIRSYIRRGLEQDAAGKASCETCAAVRKLVGASWGKTYEREPIAGEA